MKRFKLTVGMAALALTCVGAGAALWQNPVLNAEAETENGSFYMENGAAVSLNDTFSGIRWSTVVESDWYNSQTSKPVGYGTIIAPTNSFSGELTHETDFGNQEYMDIAVKYEIDPSESDVTYYSVVNYNDIVADYKEANPETTKTDAEILASAYKLELTARSYAEMPDGTFVYADVTNISTSRSARQVANMADLTGELDKLDSTKQAIGKGYMVGNEYRKETAEGDLPAVLDLENPETDVVANIADLANVGTNYEVLVGANRVDATVSGTTVTISDCSYSIEGETWLSVITESGDIYSTPIISATKVITKAEDLDIFGVGNTVSGNYSDGRLQDGYYVLGDDIDASEYTHTKGGNGIANNQSNVNNIAGAYGLTGTFDGRGYTISGLTLEDYGLFGLINGGTVKDVAFENVSLTLGMNFTYGLASVAQNATFENVYLQVNNLGSVGKTTAVGFASISDSSFKNCIFECPAEDRDETQNYGSFTAYAQNFKDVDFENTYVISPAKMGHSSKKVIDESDLVGVKRYNDAMAFINDTANNVYTSFNSICWDTTGEFPVWNGMPAYKVVEGMFSANDGLLVSGTGTTSLATLFESGATLTAEQNGTALTIDNGAIKGVEPTLIKEDGYTTDVGYVTVKVTAETASKTEIKNLLLKAYTLVIDEAEDLSLFQMKFNGNRNYMTEEQAATNKFDGYYILAKNIDASVDGYTSTSARHNGSYDTVNNKQGETASYGNEGTQEIWTDSTKSTSLGTIKEFGLTGVFDGKGYSISNMYVGFDGIFGLIGSYGTIKNVAFKGINLSNQHMMALAGFACDNAKLSNVYLEANYPNVKNKPNRLVFGQARSTVVLENCVIKATNDSINVTAYNYGLIGRMDSAPTVWTNVYVESNAPISAYYKSSYTIFDAAIVNGVAVEGGIANCYRYDTLPTGEDGKYADLIATGYFKLDDNNNVVWNTKN